MKQESDFLSAKLLLGGAGSPARTSWWPRHVQAIARYSALSGLPPAAAVRQARLSALSACAEWDAALPKDAARGLMEDHVRLEMALIDSALSDKADAVGRHGEDLIKNAALQAAELGKTVRHFPKKQWKTLLEEHVRLFAEAVRLRKEGSAQPADRSAPNTLALAAFTAEWF